METTVHLYVCTPRQQCLAGLGWFRVDAPELRLACVKDEHTAAELKVRDDVGVSLWDAVGEALEEAE
jgi:hypothetical protein